MTTSAAGAAKHCKARAVHAASAPRKARALVRRVRPAAVVEAGFAARGSTGAVHTTTLLPATALLLATLLFAAWPAAPARAEVFASQREALQQAFPEAERIERRTVLLSESEARAVERRAQSPLESNIITWHVGMQGGRVLGYALIDVHNVRTLPEAFMVVLSAKGRVLQTRILAFYEPHDYLPTERWLQQFNGWLPGALTTQASEVHGISGATFSTRAVNGGVRRALALYELLLTAGAAPAEGAHGDARQSAAPESTFDAGDAEDTGGAGAAGNTVDAGDAVDTGTAGNTIDAGDAVDTGAADETALRSSPEPGR